MLWESDLSEIKKDSSQTGRLVKVFCFLTLTHIELFGFIRMSRRSGSQGAMKHLKRKSSLLPSSVFPFPCYIALSRIVLYSPDCTLGGQKQTTEWRRLQKHAKTSHGAEKLILH